MDEKLQMLLGLDLFHEFADRRRQLDVLIEDQGAWNDLDVDLVLDPKLREHVQARRNSARCLNLNGILEEYCKDLPTTENQAFSHWQLEWDAQKSATQYSKLLAHFIKRETLRQESQRALISRLDLLRLGTERENLQEQRGLTTNELRSPRLRSPFSSVGFQNSPRKRLWREECDTRTCTETSSPRKRSRSNDGTAILRVDCGGHHNEDTATSGSVSAANAREELGGISITVQQENCPTGIPHTRPPLSDLEQRQALSKFSAFRITDEPSASSFFWTRFLIDLVYPCEVRILQLHLLLLNNLKEIRKLTDRAVSLESCLQSFFDCSPSHSISYPNTRAHSRATAGEAATPLTTPLQSQNREIHAHELELSSLETRITKLASEVDSVVISIQMEVLSRDTAFDPQHNGVNIPLPFNGTLFPIDRGHDWVFRTKTTMTDADFPHSAVVGGDSYSATNESIPLTRMRSNDRCRTNSIARRPLASLPVQSPLEEEWEESEPEWSVAQDSNT